MKTWCRRVRYWRNFCPKAITLLRALEPWVCCAFGNVLMIRWQIRSNLNPILTKVKSARSKFWPEHLDALERWRRQRPKRSNWNIKTTGVKTWFEWNKDQTSWSDVEIDVILMMIIWWWQQQWECLYWQWWFWWRWYCWWWWWRSCTPAERRWQASTSLWARARWLWGASSSQATFQPLSALWKSLDLNKRATQ